MKQDKMYNIEFTNEAIDELKALDKQNLKRAIRTIKIFEELGQQAVNSRPLSDNLFELKTDKIRIYYTYEKNKLVIIALITLKKTQKAPERLKIEANKRIENYLKQRSIKK